jgi:hypothetical protein
VFATLIIEAAALSEYWLLPRKWQIATFYCFCPLILLGINFCGVKVMFSFHIILPGMADRRGQYFGYVECFAGVLKFTFVVVSPLSNK